LVIRRGLHGGVRGREGGHIRGKHTVVTYTYMYLQFMYIYITHLEEFEDWEVY
jgi:hypothetical protein